MISCKCPDVTLRGQKFWRDFAALSHLSISLVFSIYVLIHFFEHYNPSTIIFLGQTILSVTPNYHSMFTLFSRDAVLLQISSGGYSRNSDVTAPIESTNILYLDVIGYIMVLDDTSTNVATS